MGYKIRFLQLPIVVSSGHHCAVSLNSVSVTDMAGLKHVAYCLFAPATRAASALVFGVRLHALGSILVLS